MYMYVILHTELYQLDLYIIPFIQDSHVIQQFRHNNCQAKIRQLWRFQRPGT